MDITLINSADLRTVATARILFQQQLGPMLCTLMVAKAGEKLATITQEGCTGLFIRGGIDLQLLWPDQIEETFDMVRNRTTRNAGGLTLHTMDWPGAPAPVHIIETPADGAFVLFPPGCFEGHADTHDAALA